MSARSAAFPKRRRTRASGFGEVPDGPSHTRRSEPGPSADLIEAFVARGARALEGIARRMTRRRLVEVVGAETDADLLFQAVRDSAAIGAELAPGTDPLTAALLRGAAMKRSLLRAEGGTLSAAQLAGHLGITPQGLGKKRDKNQVFWLAVGEGYVYPAFQIGPDGLLAGVHDVLDAFAERDPWARVNFMLTGDARLGGRRPIDVLRQGDVASVTRAARGYGEHGA